MVGADRYLASENFSLFHIILAHVVEELHNLLKSQNISTNLSRVITGKAKVKDWAAILSVCHQLIIPSKTKDTQITRKYIQNAQIVGSVVKGITGYRKVPVLVTVRVRYLSHLSSLLLSYTLIRILTMSIVKMFSSLALL